MKYDEKKFYSAVEEYKKAIGDAKSKSFMVIFDISNRKAFFSIAPLSRALHELDADVYAVGIDGESDAIEALSDVWKTYKAHKEGRNNEKTEALMDFVNEAEKKEHGMFKGLFDGPFILEAKENGFDGSFNLNYRDDWFKEHREKELNETCAKIW